jgi:pentatricopeptide repeat protein
MIAACLRAKVPQLDEALKVLRSMLRNKLEVGVKTYLKLIDACADAQNLKAAEEVFTAMRATGHQIYSKVYSLSWHHRITLIMAVVIDLLTWF